MEWLLAKNCSIRMRSERSGFFTDCSASFSVYSRHRLIVARVLGDDVASIATLAVGIGEIWYRDLDGEWAFPKVIALVQTLALVS